MPVVRLPEERVGLCPLGLEFGIRTFALTRHLNARQALIDARIRATHEHAKEGAD